MFAAHVYDQNAKLLKAGMVPVNLSSILIGESQYDCRMPYTADVVNLGNGCTDDTSMMSAYVDMQCSAIPIQSIRCVASFLDAVSTSTLLLSTCVQMRQAVRIFHLDWRSSNPEAVL